MCGIVGFTKGRGNLDTIQRMMARIVHRGPDSGKQYVDDEVAFGFRRLSILDLSSAGDQPMVSDSGQVILIFNGEVYNFQALRAELVDKGYSFNSTSDSEVVLKGYEAYGIDIIARLRGMFAIAIFDKNTGDLFLARDYFGIKPLYYTVNCDDGALVFGSEIKAMLEYDGIKKEFNDAALRPYLTFQTSAIDETFFKGIYNLPPAHILHVNLRSAEPIKIERFWHPDFAAASFTFEENVKRIQAVVRESVDKHRISDVKVGSFLSGGIDSSYITAQLMPDKTFSVGFYEYEQMFNETTNAKRLSELLGIENYSVIINSDDCFNALADIQYFMDEPHSNPSAVPLYFLAKLASEHVTVVLSGEGADEIFAGYPWYQTTPKIEKYEKLPFALRKIIGFCAKALPAGHLKQGLIRSAKRVEERFIGHAIVFTEDEAERVLKGKYKRGKTVADVTAPVFKRVADKDDLTKMQYLDLHVWQPNDILQKADKMSMAHSLELRVPFLDKAVFDVAKTLPSDQRVSYTETKVALRAAALANLPEEWAKRPKIGFPVPIKYWLKEEKIYNVVKAAFNSATAQQYFNTDILQDYLDRHQQGEKSYARHIWTVYCFLVWHDVYFGENNRFDK